MPSRSISRHATASIRSAALAVACTLSGASVATAALQATRSVDVPDKVGATAPAGPELAEGTFLADRVGRLDRDEKSPFPRFTLRPVNAGGRANSIGVAPNQMLRAMEEKAGSEPADFLVSGTVTQYRGRNLLLIESAAQPDAVSPLTTSATSAPAAGPTTRPPAALASDKTATAGQLLDEMLKEPPQSAAGGGGGTTAGAVTGAKPLAKPETPPETDATSGKGAVKPGAPGVSVLREGTYLVDRLGRLTRGPDGATAEFTFESDGAALQDPPVVIIPNLKLMAMEDAAQTINRDLRFRVTGMVTEYRGRNYVLLEKVVVVPDATQQYRRTQQP